MAQDKLVAAIAKMVELTQEGTLRWSAGVVTGSGPARAVTPPFYANYAGKRLRLQKVSHRRKRETFDVLFSSPEPEWVTEVVLELVDSNDTSLWRFPEVEPVEDLLRAAQRQAAGVEEFLSSLISEK